MGALGTAAKAALALTGCLIAADIAGVIACTILDILPLRFVSGPLFYTIWLVFGIFCGLLAYNLAGSWASPREAGKDWSERFDAGRTGNVILVTSALVLAGLAFLFHRLFWRFGGGSDPYVPDSPPHSILFLAAVMGAVALARFGLMPGRPGRSGAR